MKVYINYFNQKYKAIDLLLGLFFNLFSDLLDLIKKLSLLIWF
jgi:hypothetical protein